MSENESLKMGKSTARTVPVYRVALIREATVIDSPCACVRKSSEAAELLRPLFTDLDREHFVILMLDAQHRPIGVNVVSIGSLPASVVHPRETMKTALLCNS